MRANIECGARFDSKNRVDVVSLSAVVYSFFLKK